LLLVTWPSFVVVSLWLWLVIVVGYVGIDYFWLLLVMVIVGYCCWLLATVIVGFVIVVSYDYGWLLLCRYCAL